VLAHYHVMIALRLRECITPYVRKFPELDFLAEAAEQGQHQGQRDILHHRSSMVAIDDAIGRRGDFRIPAQMGGKRRALCARYLHIFLRIVESGCRALASEPSNFTCNLTSHQRHLST
jgi:hypothetical protein